MLLVLQNVLSFVSLRGQCSPLPTIQAINQRLGSCVFEKFVILHYILLFGDVILYYVLWESIYLQNLNPSINRALAVLAQNQKIGLELIVVILLCKFCHLYGVFVLWGHDNKVC
jgi:hypothetical protein